MSVCRIEPSWILLRAPIVMRSLSPRATTPNQTPQSSPMTTSPIIAALGAIQ